MKKWKSGISIQIKLNQKQKYAMAMIAACILLVLPFVISNTYVMHVLITSGLYIGLSLSLNLVSGYAGQLSMGHAAFYGIGAYTTALLMLNLNMSFWLTLIASIVVSGLAGLILGLPTSRLRGDYLTIVTLGFGEIVRLVLVNEIDITRGPMGLPGIPAPSLFGVELDSKRAFYYLVLLFVVIVTVFLSRLTTSGFGIAMMTVKEDEIAAQSIGIYPMKYKLSAFILSAMIAGVTGSIYATYVSFVSPDTFLFNDSATILAMVVLGGIGSIPGSIIGAVILTVMPELLRSFSEYRMMLYGILLVVMMNFKPTGIYGQEKRKRNIYKRQAGGIMHE